MITKETEQKIRKLLLQSESILGWAKTELENDDLQDSILYGATIQSLGLISQIKKELEENDSNITGASNSKKFKEQKLFP